MCRGEFQQRDSSTMIKNFIHTLIIAVYICCSNVAKSDHTQSCHRKAIGVFICSHGNLTSFPANIPYGTTQLDLSYNSLVYIPSLHLRNASSLITFNLSHNAIASMDRYAFKHMDSLVDLDMSYNNLRGSSLIVEELRVEMGIFPALKHMTLRRNPLGTLKGFTFTSFAFTNLETLDLSQCSLTKLEHLAIDNLSRLKVLNLSHNLLETLNSMSIAGILELQVLDLSYNRLVIIQDMPMTFSLHTILLGNNLVRAIKDNVFQVVKGLKVLNLERNQLRALNHLSVPWGTLDELILENNPWFCDCHMKWILDYKEEYSFNYSMICTYPSRLRGRNVFTLYPDDMSCPENLLTVVVTLILSLTLIMGLSGTVLVLYNKRKSLTARCRKGDDVKGRYVAVYSNENGQTDGRVDIEDTKTLTEKHNTEIYA